MAIAEADLFTLDITSLDAPSLDATPDKTLSQRFEEWDKPLAIRKFKDEQGNLCSLAVIAVLLGCPEANIPVGVFMNLSLGEFYANKIAPLGIVSHAVCQLNNNEGKEAVLNYLLGLGL